MLFIVVRKTGQLQLPQVIAIAAKEAAGYLYDAAVNNLNALVGQNGSYPKKSLLPLTSGVFINMIGRNLKAPKKKQ